MSKPWYDGLFSDADDALGHALSLLEGLRGALPRERAGAVDEAAALLRRACALYACAKKAAEQAPGPCGAPSSCEAPGPCGAPSPCTAKDPDQ